MNSFLKRLKTAQLHPNLTVVKIQDWIWSSCLFRRGQGAAAGFPAGESWLPPKLESGTGGNKSETGVNLQSSCWLSQALLHVAWLLLISSRDMHPLTTTTSCLSVSLGHSLSFPLLLCSCSLCPTCAYLPSPHPALLKPPYLRSTKDGGSTAPSCVSTAASQPCNEPQTFYLYIYFISSFFFFTISLSELRTHAQISSENPSYERRMWFGV